MNVLNALVLAGGDERAFISIGGRCMVEHVVDALWEAEHIGDIAIVGDKAKLKPLLGNKITHYIQGGNNLFESVDRGIEPFALDRHVIIITSDIPLIKPCIIDEFVAKCRLDHLDLYYPIVEKTINDKQFPGIKRTYVKLKEGRFTGGNILCLNPVILGKCQSFARELLDNRKMPWRIGRMLGYKFLTLLLVGQITISSVEERLYELLGIKCKAIISSHGEIVNDLDKVSDAEIISKFF